MYSFLFLVLVLSKDGLIVFCSAKKDLLPRSSWKASTQLRGKSRLVCDIKLDFNILYKKYIFSRKTKTLKLLYIYIEIVFIFLTYKIYL